MVRRCWVNFQYRGVLLVGIKVGAGGVVWTFFLSFITSCISPSLWETARYRLKYCLKGPFSLIQPTNHLFFVHAYRNQLIAVECHCSYLKCCFFTCEATCAICSLISVSRRDKSGLFSESFELTDSLSSSSLICRSKMG